MQYITFYFLIFFFLSSLLISGDTSSSTKSIIYIPHATFDKEFNTILKSKLHYAYNQHPQQTVNTINALNSNLAKEKISFASINKKFSKILIGSLCIANALFFVYAQIYGEMRHLFCSQSDACYNLGFHIKKDALDEYLLAIVTPWIATNFLICGIWAHSYRKNAHAAQLHNFSVDKNRREADQFLGSLRSGTYTPNAL